MVMATRDPGERVTPEAIIYGQIAIWLWTERRLAVGRLVSVVEMRASARLGYASASGVWRPAA